MKIISYNVNGIRSAISKGFIDWLQQAKSYAANRKDIRLHTGYHEEGRG